jgi:hypothetical protein
MAISKARGTASSKTLRFGFKDQQGSRCGLMSREMMGIEVSETTQVKRSGHIFGDILKIVSKRCVCALDVEHEGKREVKVVAAD